jgi:hypothetical protein
MVSRLHELKSLIQRSRRDGSDVRPTLLRNIVDAYVSMSGHTRPEMERFTELVLRLMDSADYPTLQAIAAQLKDDPATPRAVMVRLGKEGLLDTISCAQTDDPPRVPTPSSAEAMPRPATDILASLPRETDGAAVVKPAHTPDSLFSWPTVPAFATTWEKPAARGATLRAAPQAAPAPVALSVTPVEPALPASFDLFSIAAAAPEDLAGLSPDVPVAIEASSPALASPEPQPVIGDLQAPLVPAAEKVAERAAESATESATESLAEPFIAAPMPHADAARRYLAADSAARIAMVEEISGLPDMSPPISGEAETLARHLEDAALTRRLTDFAAQLARALHVPQSLAQQIADDKGGEPVAVAARALDISSDSLLRILLFLNPAVGLSISRVFELSEFFDKLPRATALRMVAGWQAMGEDDGTPRRMTAQATHARAPREPHSSQAMAAPRVPMAARQTGT